MIYAGGTGRRQQGELIPVLLWIQMMIHVEIFIHMSYTQLLHAYIVLVKSTREGKKSHHYRNVHNELQNLGFYLHFPVK